MTREELERRAAGYTGDMDTAREVIALVVEACCAEIKSFCFITRETGDQALTRRLKITFLHTPTKPKEHPPLLEALFVSEALHLTGVGNLRGACHHCGVRLHGPNRTTIDRGEWERAADGCHVASWSPPLPTPTKESDRG